MNIAGVQGGKVRSCWALSQGALGLVTAGSRASPQVNIVAHIARKLGIPARCHTPSGELSPEVAAAAAQGAEIVQHKAGYNNVIVARAREDAAARGWVEIPFGMECAEAPRQTRQQAANLPPEARRLVVPVGSGMSLAGILWGLIDAGRDDLPVLGVVVGADPEKRLDAYAPPDWRDRVTLVRAPQDYHEDVEAEVGGVRLDPHYEAKCKQFMTEGDCLWVVGIRQTEAHIDTSGWTFGNEIELVDWDTRRKVKPTRFYATSEVASVNSDGQATRPDHPFGGEVNTYPTSTPEGQGEALGEFMGFFPEARGNYRGSVHTHICVPGIGKDLAALLRLFRYSNRWMPWFIEHYHNPGEPDAAWKAQDPDGSRWRYCTIDTQMPPAWRIAQIEAATTADEFFRFHMLNKQGEFVALQAKRYAVNFLMIPKTGCLEIRCFAPTTEPDGLATISRFARAFCVAGLVTGEPLPDVIERNAFTFNRWFPFDAGLENSFHRTKLHADRSTPKWVILGTKRGGGSAVVRPG